MPAKRITISLSSEALATVDRDAAREGISRSAWFLRVAQRESRRQALKQAVAQAHSVGVLAASDRELEALRKQIA